MAAYLIGAQTIILGVSTVTEINATSYQNGGIVKKVGDSQVVSFTDGLSFGVGTGYPLSDNEAIEFDGPATFFLATSGTTCTISIMRSYSAGATGLPTLPPFVVGGFL